MITATVEHETLAGLAKKASKIQDCRYAVILHDKDLGSSHLHLAMTVENARSIESVAKDLKIPNNFIQKWDRRTNNLWSYLTHETSSASRVKVNYKHYLADPTKFVTNIDNFEELIKNPKHNTNELNTIISKILIGELTRKELLKPEMLQTYYDNMYKIDHAIKLRTESLKYNPPACNTKYIYGASGTGKTTKAIEIAISLYPNSYTVGSAPNDLLQDYTGEKCLIIDDFRPQNFDFVELLMLLDPIHRQRTHKSRYYNKPLASELIIITSTLPLHKTIDYYQSLNRNEDMKQLRRRIQTVTNMDSTTPVTMIYDEQLDDYVDLPKFD
jgi:hypothetical protein